MSHIFISYSRKDIVFAQKIVDALAANKLDTWIDWKSIPKGEDWEQEIYRGIEGADAFVFLISPDSVSSEMCNKEIVHAVKHQRRILPVVLRDGNVKDFLEEVAEQAISKRNWIFCRDGKDEFSRAIEETLKTIHTDFDWLKYHTKLHTKALDWERTKKDVSRLIRDKELREAEQQLATAGSLRDPQPTDIQRQFIAASRQAEQSRQKAVRRTVVIVSTIIALLCVIAGFGGGAAYLQSQARATAQTQAQEQGDAATGRQLASQAQLLPLLGPSMITSGLLSVEAAHLNPGLEAQQALSRFSNSIGNPILRLQSESDRPVSSISYDGRLIAVGDANGNLRIWDATLWKEISGVQNIGWVGSLDFSPTDNRIVSVGRDLIVWDAETGEKIFSNDAPPGGYWFDASFSPDGTAIISLVIKEDGKSTLIALDAMTGQEISHFELDGTETLFSLSSQNTWAVVTQEFDHERQLVQIFDWKSGTKVSERSVNLSYNVQGFHLGDSRIVSASEYTTIEVWDAYSGNIVLSAEVCKSSIYSMIISPNTQRIAVGCAEGTLVILGSQDLLELMKSRQNDLADDYTYDPIFKLEFNKDGSRIVTGGINNGTAIVWDIDSKSEIARMPHAGFVRSVAFDPVKDWVISTGDEAWVTVWKPETGLMEYQITEENGVKSISFKPNGRLLVAANRADLHTWDIDNSQLIQSQTLTSSIFTPVVFSTDGTLMIAASDNDTVKSFDVDSGNELSMVQHSDYWIESISLDSNKKRVISGSPTAGYLMWNPVSGEIIGSVDMSTQPPSLSPNGQLIAYVVDSDNLPIRDLVIRDIESGNRVLTISDGNNPIVFSPDNSVVAFTNFDFETLRVWRITENQEIFSATHDGVITSITFSTDGKYLITVSRDAAIRVWETATGREVAKLMTPSPVSTLAISPDNRLIAFSYDNVVYGWVWRVTDLADQVCSHLPRNLTRSEWNQYIGEEIPYRATCPNLPTEPEVMIPPTP